MLYSMRLRNLRSFSNSSDAPYVDLKPLTVFLGKNSSGKSSFLRSLPLLRQSVEANTTGPILWFGSYVDFGAFSEAKKYDCDSDVIYFDFKLKIDMQKNSFFQRQHFQKKIRKNTLDVSIEVGVSEVDKKTVANQLKVQVDENEYFFKFEEKSNRCSLIINDKDKDKDKDKLIFDNLSYVVLNQFLPLIGIFNKTERIVNGEKRTESRFEEEFFEEYFSKLIEKELKKYFHHKTSALTIRDGVSRIGINDRKDIKAVLHRIFKGNVTFITNLEKSEKSICDLVYNLSMHAGLPELLRNLNTEVRSTFESVRYIAPLRATAERYYRHQDLQIEEIDHTGSNLAMLLRSFSATENEKFSTWTMSNFGFSVRVEELGLHYALKIKTDTDDREYNINDMGFGFSQILPIVAFIWMETVKKINRYRSIHKPQIIFAIEQPELHLHPEYQSRLARMFASAVDTAKKNHVNLTIIFETHSQTMVDTLGDCIDDELIEKDDINIVLFEKNIESNSTKIKFSQFDDDGYLENWPVGFFSGRK